MRTATLALLACASLVFLPMAQQASAVMMVPTSLATTSHALVAPGISGGVWQGSQVYSKSLPFSGDIGTVEFAVFAPGDFQSFLDDNGILFSDPAPSEYIYAYQVIEIPAGDSVTNFSVGIDNDEAAGIAGVSYIPAATDYGTYPYVPSMNPGATSGGPGSGSYSVTWDAVLPSFGPGEVTPILFYSSPQLPELGNSVLAGLPPVSYPLSMPNPVPEPGTVGLTLLAALLAGTIRRAGREL